MRRKRSALILITTLLAGPLISSAAPAATGVRSQATPAKDPVSFAYLPAGFTVQPVIPKLSWDDFYATYLYESPSRADWTVSTEGSVFGDTDPCKRIPASFRPTIASTKLTTIGEDGKPEVRTERVAVFTGGAPVRKWLFEGDTRVVGLRPSTKAKTASISTLLTCSTGSVLIAQGKLTRAQLVARYRDPSNGGALVMTDWEPPYNPSRNLREIKGPSGTITVDLADDPRTAAWFPFVGPERASVGGTTALVRRDKFGVAVLWFIRPGLLGSVSSQTVALDELVKVANGLSVPAP